MRVFAKKSPWYAAGLAFECEQCGRCCAGPEEGFVWVTDEDIQAIAAHLGMTVEQVRKRYVRRAVRRLSLVEDPTTRDCVFLRRDAEGNSHCEIYPVRPVQCRTWPFWPGNLRSPNAWARAGERCPGINRGEVVPCEQIQQRRERTRG